MTGARRVGAPAAGLVAAGAAASDELSNPAVGPADDRGESVRLRAEMVGDLFIDHYRRLVGLSRLLVGDQATAEDVVQDAFLALYRHRSRVRAVESALPFLQTSVVNGSRIVLRHRRVLSSVHIPGVPDEPAADGPALEHEQRADVRAAVGRLPGRQRQVLVLRYYLDLDERQIAEMLGISTGSVKRHASRGMDALSRCIRADQS